MRQERATKRNARVSRVADLLAHGYYSWQISGMIAKEFGCAWATARHDIEIAMRLLRWQHYGKNNEKSIVPLTLAQLDAFIQDSTISPSVRLGAISEKCKILGLYKPTKVDGKIDAQATVRIEVAYADDWAGANRILDVPNCLEISNN